VILEILEKQGRLVQVVILGHLEIQARLVQRVKLEQLVLEKQERLVHRYMVTLVLQEILDELVISI